MRRSSGTVTVADFCRIMEDIAPCHTAATWDNVGLIIGDSDWKMRRCLLTIDLTSAVLDEVIRSRCDCVMAYHPPIFNPTKRIVVGRSSQARIAAEALSRRIAVYSPHTALDASPGGTNDVLAVACGLMDIQPTPQNDPPSSPGFCKLVVFVPEQALDSVAAALFKAGCGRIGEYDQCSFRSQGQGTFFGKAAARPRVGQRGRLERVREFRLEVTVDERHLVDAIQAMRQTHPYETPAFDVYKLAPIPQAGAGPGRVGRFAKPTPLAHLARSLQRRIGAANVLLVGNPAARVTRGLVCVGAAGRLPFDFPGLGDQRDVVITGEFRHHDALEYERRGVCAIALGHWASERPVLSPLATMLRKCLPGVQFVVSRADCDPLKAL